MNQSVEDSMERGLRRSSFGRARRFAVEAVLDDVQVKRREVDAAKVIERVIHHVKLEILVGLLAAAEERLRPVKYPAVQLVELFGGERVFLGVEIVEVADQKPRRVAQLAIGLDEAIQYLVGDPDVFAIIL